MAFPNGWARRYKLEINNSKIDETLTDYPVLIKSGQLPNEMFDNDGDYPALEGGGDIRFSLDKAGTQQLSLEVESFHLDNHPTSANSCQLWVKSPSVSTSVNTPIYCWYHKAGEAQPAVDAAYGRNSVWEDNFISVYHMNEISGSICYDSCGRHNGTFHGTLPDNTWSKIGQGQLFNGTSDYISIPDHADFDTYTYCTISCWYMPSDLTGEIWRGILTKDREQFSAHTVGIWESNGITPATNFRVGQVAGGETDMTENQFSLLHLSWGHNGGAIRGSIDGFVNVEYTTANGEPANGVNPVYIGRSFTGSSNEFAKGKIVEARWSKEKFFSDGWKKADWESQEYPSTFWTLGTPESPNQSESSEKSMYRGISIGINRGIC